MYLLLGKERWMQQISQSEYSELITLVTRFGTGIEFHVFQITKAHPKELKFSEQLYSNLY